MRTRFRTRWLRLQRILGLWLLWLYGAPLSAQKPIFIYYIDTSATTGMVEITNEEGMKDLALWKTRSIVELEYHDTMATAIPEFILALDSARNVGLFMKQTNEAAVMQLLARSFGSLSVNVAQLEELRIAGECHTPRFYLECRSIKLIDLEHAGGLLDVGIDHAPALRTCRIGNSVNSLSLNDVGCAGGATVTFAYGPERKHMALFDIHDFCGTVHYDWQRGDVGQMHVDLNAWRMMVANSHPVGCGSACVSVSQLYMSAPPGKTVESIRNEVDAPFADPKRCGMYFNLYIEGGGSGPNLR